MPPRKVETTAEYTVKELQGYKARLKKCIEKIDDYLDAAKRNKAKRMFLFRRPSADEGLRRLEVFVRDMERTAAALDMGIHLSDKSKKEDLP